jgi:hypothetical protein
MTGFFIKKAFFDGWDNFISIILFNVLTVGLLALGYGALQLIQFSLVLTVLVLVVWFVITHILLAAISFYEGHHASYQRPGYEEFKAGIASSWKHALLLSAVDLVLMVTILLVIPFYFRMGSFIGTAIGSLLVWIVILTLLSLIYFLPIAYQLGDRPYKSLKKAYIIALDNPLFTLFMGVYSLISMILSVVTALLVPGTAGVLLAHQGACRLLMFKYDYLEQEGNENRKKEIPWAALLLEEKEKVGQRSFKGMIFPWKE